MVEESPQHEFHRMNVFRLVRHLLTMLGTLCCVLLVSCLLFWDQLPSLSPKRTFPRRKEWLEETTEYSVANHPINCSKLFQGDQNEIARARNIKSFNSALLENYYILQSNCTEFIARRKYITNVTKQEKDFPIAFSIVVYKDFQQFERLLRAVYRPHNVYCVHLDSKATTAVRDPVTRLVSCLPRVFIASRSLNVQWGKFSVLEAELVCLKELLEYKNWRYVINLTGQEYPLKTNRQLVHILTAYGGANDIEGTVKRMINRKERWGQAGNPPHNIRPVKGAVHIVANRHFVEYAIFHPVAKDLLSWVNKTKIPDETFFATLNHNPQLGIPGTYQGEPETDLVKKPFLARYKIWDSGKLFRGMCNGKYVRQICIFGVGDLAKFPERKELIANKFHQDFQPATLDCMEEWYDGMVQAERDGVSVFDASYYRTLGFVKHQVL